MNLIRLRGFIRKETLQMIRDPSSILMALVLPILMMFIYGFGVSLDMNNIRIGLALEDDSALAHDLANAFVHNPYFHTVVTYDRRPLEEDLTNSNIRGFVVIPQDFSKKFFSHDDAAIQVIADGSETNTANFVQNYAQGVVGNWVEQKKQQRLAMLNPPIRIENRVWFNPGLESRDVLLPGAMAIIMSLIGILLTALVVAREWERGTMEAMMATPIHISEIIVGKLTPYFILGLGSMTLCVMLATLYFGIPLRGPLSVILLATTLFLIACLTQGLLISTLAKNQFVACQVSLMVGFLPAFMLSGFLFEIQSMPWPIQMITYLLPPRYFVTILQTNFLAGAVWELFLPNLFALTTMAALFLFIASKRIVKRLD